MTTVQFLHTIIITFIAPGHLLKMAPNPAMDAWQVLNRDTLLLLGRLKPGLMSKVLHRPSEDLTTVPTLNKIVQTCKSKTKVQGFGRPDNKYNLQVKVQ